MTEKTSKTWICKGQGLYKHLPSGNLYWRTEVGGQRTFRVLEASNIKLAREEIEELKKAGTSRRNRKQARKMGQVIELFSESAIRQNSNKNDQTNPGLKKSGIAFCCWNIERTSPDFRFGRRRMRS